MSELGVAVEPIHNDSRISAEGASNDQHPVQQSELNIEPDANPQLQLNPAAPLGQVPESHMSNIAFKLLKLFVTLAAVLLGTFAVKMLLSISDVRSQVMHPNFEDYRAKFGKQYDSENEHSYRQYVYYQRLQDIAKHNEQPFRSYQQGVNAFTDMTQEEFRNVYLLVRSIGAQKGYIRVDTSKEDQKEEQNDQIIKGQTFPAVDYRHLLPPIKNQYHCAGCYSFPIVAAVEALYAQQANNGTVYSLSEQELIDCASEYMKGCQNGSIEKGFEYIIKNGIHEEKEYRFRSKDGISYNCTLLPSHRFKISKLVDIPRGKCSTIQKLLNTGPVVVKLDASNWVSYKEGIFDNCGRLVNHGLLVVGRTKDYWLIRNSWGKSWGEYGHIRLAKGNTCGLCDAASYPIIADKSSNDHNK